MRLEKFMKDKVTVKTMEGKTYTNIAALVQSDKILTSRTDIPIRPGDRISRITPAGVEETFIVEDPGFNQGLGGIPATYQMLVCRVAESSKSITNPQTVYAKAFRMLEIIYEQTIGKEEPILIEEIQNNLGLSEGDVKEAWRYLRDKNLIETFSIPYTARINAYGIDVIENARLHPDKPAKNFPSVTYHYITQNTVTAGTISNSPIQQGGAQANMTQTVSYSTQDLDDLRRLVEVFEKHIDDLALDAVAKRKTIAQVATIRAQLEDEPDMVIVKQAGRTLRNITEGVIASLIATAAQPTVWAWVAPIIAKLFSGT